jgi:pimeloyl-ACP methyl ester carboxylesterase
MSDFTHHTVQLKDVAMYYVTAGRADGPPVLLLHGWPQTWFEWRHVMRLLADDYRLIAPDLRGLGDTSRPEDGYDSATIAGDLVELLDHLAITRYHLAGHDWGGPTAFALAHARPDAVATFTIVDVTVPGLGPDVSQGGRRWHHAFHMTPDLPETLVAGREREYLSWFYGKFSHRPDAIGEDDITEYVRTYSQPGALTAGFNYYRNIPANKAANIAIQQSGFRLPMPVLAVGGAEADAMGRGEEPELSLREIADNVTGAVVAESGHFVPEEQPEALAALLRRHFDGGPL